MFEVSDGPADFCLMMKYFVMKWEEIKRDKVSVKFYVLLKGLVVHNVELCREQRSNVGSLKINSSPSVATIAGTGTVGATAATVGATVATAVATEATVGATTATVGAAVATTVATDATVAAEATSAVGATAATVGATVATEAFATVGAAVAATVATDATVAAETAASTVGSVSAVTEAEGATVALAVVVTAVFELSFELRGISESRNSDKSEDLEHFSLFIFDNCKNLRPFKGLKSVICLLMG